MDYFETDENLIYQALIMWANYIETNDPGLSANDAIRINQNDMLQPLSTEQMEFIVRVRKLAKKQIGL